VAFEIACVSALEIIDSIARPTLEVGIQLTDGTRASATVPTGPTLCPGHALELRDQDVTRFDGDGVLTARERIKHLIAPTLAGRPWFDLAEIDQALISLDADPDMPPLGANATLGVSIAVARALARSAGRSVHAWLPGTGQKRRLPLPVLSMLTGSALAPHHLSFADLMICPIGAPSMADAVRAGVEVYHAIHRRLDRDGLTMGVSDDGGFWCGLTKPEMALRLIINAIHDAGYSAGTDGIAIAIDVAASALRRDDGNYQVGNETLSSTDMISWYTELVDAFPIWSIEDGLSPDDILGWQSLTDALGGRVQLVADELCCAHPERIQRAADTGIANAAALKLDHVATVSQALQSLRLCNDLGYAQIITQSPGETGDTFIADLAIASGCGQLAAGAPARSERVNKYNRLIQIAANTSDLPFGMA